MAFLENRASKPDFPARKLVVLLACRLVEPLAMTSITPYAFFMVQHVAPELSESEAARYLTIVYSAYALSQFATNFAWGRISDRVGRRAVMLLGLAAITVCTLGFGFADSLAAVLVFRIAAGLLSGNVVIVRTIIGEAVHGQENKARAFAWNQTVFQTGYVLGPLIGGYLARPCTQFPGLCAAGRWPLLDRYPFALPNLIIGFMAAISLVTGYFCIEESLASKQTARYTTDEPAEDTFLLPASPKKTEPLSLRDAVTPQVIHVVLSYGIMALHTICFDQIFPVFLSTSPEKGTLPFMLRGGLGFGSDAVATYMSASGILSIVLMVTVFPVVDSRLGSLVCLNVSTFLYPVTYFLLPYLAVLPSSPAGVRLAAVSAVLFTKTLAAVFSFNESSVLLSTAAPSHSTLGVVNGLAQTGAAAARSLGPVGMGLFMRLGSRIGCDALGWWFLAATGVVGVVQTFCIAGESGHGRDEEPSEVR